MMNHVPFQQPILEEQPAPVGHLAQPELKAQASYGFCAYTMRYGKYPMYLQVLDLGLEVSVTNRYKHRSIIAGIEQ